MEDYRKELQQLHHKRINYILLCGAVMMLLFSFLDYFTVPDLYYKFLGYRFGVVVICLLLFLVNSADKECRYPLWIGFSAFSSVIVVILIMIHQIGGAFSPYYVGLIVALALYVTLAPLTLSQALAMGGLLVCSYLLTIVSSHSISSPYILDFFNNLFFMVCFILIVATQSWADTEVRKSEYLLRKEEKYANGELSRHAEMLEMEVKKRTVEQDLLEERYRQLFNQLADDVVVVTPAGRVVQSNRRFEEHFCPGKSVTEMSFADIVLEHDWLFFEKVLAQMVATGTWLSDKKMTLVRKNGSLLEVEVNGNVLMRDGTAKGILLIMRDLTVRKKLEAQLKESLEKKKKTETSAILVLAKLSEFRDVTPHNHLERVREYCRLLAEELSHSANMQDIITPRYIEDIYHASILHDIGKVAIPDEYMAGDAPLVEYERDMIRRHTLIGGDVIREMEEESQGSGFLSMAKHIAYFHHERWDGTGYPYGLSRREIPLAARIMAVADAYEELTTVPAKDTTNQCDKAVEYIVQNKGTRFDPMVVESFLVVQVRFERVLVAFPQ
ncbi:HD domain-containing phosphohydrolase [Desulforhopalus sp. IMCC35007]|uniref:HD domain-containing phosphohydrolase n=1 Tax=Desulforhopalus sp. IMCC35007 TaxID=2569543 RepID=UPI0010AE3A0C|nr:HD domain-containing phosphohydrolase [Desulforhopalus sp. IMCC35007]TKB06919.1 HD domain-containing protein [Desulforhopalus sp. IMCC35007]